jgi:hypothetical protein
MPAESEGEGEAEGLTAVESEGLTDGVDPDATVLVEPPEHAASARAARLRAANAVVRWCRGACTSSSSGPPP